MSILQIIACYPVARYVIFYKLLSDKGSLYVHVIETKFAIFHLFSLIELKTILMLFCIDYLWMNYLCDASMASSFMIESLNSLVFSLWVSVGCGYKTKSSDITNQILRKEFWVFVPFYFISSPRVQCVEFIIKLFSDIISFKLHLKCFSWNTFLTPWTKGSKHHFTLLWFSHFFFFLSLQVTKARRKKF